MSRRNVALKLDEDVYGQVAILAQLETTEQQSVTVPDVIRQAVAEHLARKRVELSDRAAEVLADIEREAEERRQQIAALFGPAAGDGEAVKPRGRRGQTEPAGS